MTPEGRVKAKVKQVLAKYPSVYQHWPVPAGFGAVTLDCLGCYRGHFFAIETKATPGDKLTAMQQKCANDMTLAGGTVFRIDNNPATLDLLVAWLDARSAE